MNFLLLFVFACLAAFISHRIKRYKRKVIRRNRECWSIGIYEGRNPFTIRPMKNISNPVFSADRISDIKARFVADPFMIENDNTFYLFFEALNIKTNKGEIGYATSTDLKKWKYGKIVLRERFHLSYPYVFCHGGAIYMIPECENSKGVQLYKATSFPDLWTHTATLISKRNRLTPLSDPSIVNHDGRWYLFVNARRSRNLHLYTAVKLTGPWTEHPESPVITSDPHFSRPGGRIVRYGEHLYRYSQDGIPCYGSKVWAFRILELNVSLYREEPVSDKPVIQAGNEKWNSIGMHTVDAHLTDDGNWLAFVDGLEHKKPSF